MSTEDDVKRDVKGLSKYFQSALDKLHTHSYTNLAKAMQHWIKVLEEGHVTDEQWLEIFRVYEQIEHQIHPVSIPWSPPRHSWQPMEMRNARARL